MQKVEFGGNIVHILRNNMNWARYTYVDSIVYM